MAESHQYVGQASPVVQFLDASFRGIGQVYLANNPLSGFLFLVAVAVNDPLLGAMCLLGAFSATATAMIMRLSPGATANGLFGYNGCLVGIALGLFHWPGPNCGWQTGCSWDGTNHLWYNGLVLLPVVFLSGASALLTASVSRALVRSFGLVPLTFPFQLVTWMWMLACQQTRFFPLGSASPTNSPITISVAPTVAVYENVTAAYTYAPADTVLGIFSGVGQTFLAGQWYSGVIMLAGIALCSPISAAMALLGSALGTASAMVMGVPPGPVYAGLMGYNPALCAVSIGGFFYVLNSWRVAVLTASSVVVCAVFNLGLASFLAVFGLPTLTCPFTLVVWAYCLLGGAMPGCTPVAISALSTPEDHLRRVNVSKMVLKRTLRRFVHKIRRAVRK